MQSMWNGQDFVSPTDFKSEVSRFARRFGGYKLVCGVRLLGVSCVLQRLLSKYSVLCDLLVSANSYEVVACMGMGTFCYDEQVDCASSCQLPSSLHHELQMELFSRACHYDAR